MVVAAAEEMEGLAVVGIISTLETEKTTSSSSAEAAVEGRSRVFSASGILGLRPRLRLCSDILKKLVFFFF